MGDLGPLPGEVLGARQGGLEGVTNSHGWPPVRAVGGAGRTRPVWVPCGGLGTLQDNSGGDTGGDELFPPGLHWGHRA